MTHKKQFAWHFYRMATVFSNIKNSYKTRYSFFATFFSFVKKTAFCSQKCLPRKKEGRFVHKNACQKKKQAVLFTNFNPHFRVGRFSAQKCLPRKKEGHFVHKMRKNFFGSFRDVKKNHNKKTALTFLAFFAILVFV
ncbi:MAG: hypothetical protein II811_10070 [Spirochaetaceae bacterium]|nr:hypothetical protein [Spirochaetaceae bacterium]